MENIEEKIRKTEAKISRQKQLLIGAERMSKNYSNTQAMISQCNQEINEINRNIEFLQIQLKELEIKKQRLSVGDERESVSNSQIQLRTESRPIINTIDLRRFEESSLTIEKITFKLQEIGYKKNVELKLREGFEKLLRVYHMDPTIGDKKSRAEAEECIQSCSQRINLLERALKRYIDFNDLSSVQVDPDGAIWKKPALRKAMTGTISIRILNARNMARLNDSDIFIKVKVDSVIKGQTKSLKPDKMGDFFEFSVEKASELELLIFGNRLGTTPAPIGIFWLPIRELNDAIRSNALSSSSWINKNNNGAPQPPQPRESIEGWFSVEPVGQIQLKVDFQKYSGPARRSSKLGRQGAVRKRKEPTVEHNGHSFVVKQFYSIMTCALCNEFLMGGTGYQCEDCRYFCHKKCGPQVVFKCISKAHSEADAEKINHRIPHRFESVSNFTANWCYHCGQMLPLGKRACNKCTECEVTAHTHCSHLVPNLCGLSMSQANQMLLAIRQAKQSKQSKSEPASDAKSKSKIDPNAQQIDLPNASNLKRTKIEDFDFLAVLGRGNFGKVMLSREKSTSNLFAIKVLKKEMIIQSKEVEGLRSERRVFMTANQDRHPFLLGLHSCFQSPTRIYFVMEYISGGDLMWHIQRKPFTSYQAKFYAVEVLLGLDHLHKNKIVYRDLKLDNILLDLDGHIRIADYGLCKENMGYGATTNTFCGTPEFLAPEILQEQGYGRAVDWWAFGVLLYEMRLGQSPFYGSEEDEIYDSILEDDVLYPYNLERETVSILQKLLTRDPRYRLGGGPEDAEDVKRHTYFKGIVWEDFLSKKVTPPLQPTISKPDDISNFDEVFTAEKAVLTPIDNNLNTSDQSEFSGFSYTAEWVGDRRE